MDLSTSASKGSASKIAISIVDGCSRLDCPRVGRVGTSVSHSKIAALVGTEDKVIRICGQHSSHATVVDVGCRGLVDIVRIGHIPVDQTSTVVGICEIVRGASSIDRRSRGDCGRCCCRRGSRGCASTCQGCGR